METQLSKPRLARFVAPLDPATLVDRKLRRELPLHTGRSTGWHPDLFGWDRLIDLAAGIADEDEIKVTANRHYVPFSFYADKAGQVERARIEALMARGASVIMPHSQRYDTDLGAVAREYIAAGGSATWIGVIGSTGEVGALKRHCDRVDLFILQVEGEKHWRIYGTDEHADDPVFETTLVPGDYLFLPAGQFHECETCGGSSLHLGMGFDPRNYRTFG